MHNTAFTRYLLALVTVACVSSPAEASEPTVDSIDYSKPASYLAIRPSLGDVKQIAEVASGLKGRDDRTTIRRVSQWMDANLKYDAKAAYQWRNFDDVVKSGCYGGCADQGIVCGALLKAAGIPTVWVKAV